jgi:hypothetical protein
MATMSQQYESFPAPDLEKQRKNPLDELYQSIKAYRNSKSYVRLLQFISRFPNYSPFNCFLLQMQNPSLSYVATAEQWSRRLGRQVKPEAHPMIILAPMTPVLFVFDLADTEGDQLPPELERPFETTGRLPLKIWNHTVTNCEERDRIVIVLKSLSKLQAGSARSTEGKTAVSVGGKKLPAKHVVELNGELPLTDQYSTLVHELGHIHCGHLGSDSDLWWPNRPNLDKPTVEFEAESVSYIVCKRLGLETTSAQYLAGYVRHHIELPRISLYAVLKAAGYIQEIGERLLPERKPPKQRKVMPEKRPQ